MPKPITKRSTARRGDNFNDDFSKLKMLAIFQQFPAHVQDGLLTVFESMSAVMSTGYGSITIEVKDDRVQVQTTFSNLYKDKKLDK